jgi:microcystin-dependent protein
MALEVKHEFQSAKGDGPDTTLVQPSDWNALHQITMEPGIMGNPTDSVGPAVVIPLGAGLTFNETTGELENTNRALPVGLVLPLAGNYEPPGWLICDGRAVSRTTYNVLYTICQDKFGSGDGVTTFNIPDMRGRVPAGKDNLGGTAANRLTPATMPGGATDVGKVAGTERHILLAGEIPTHTHTVSPDTHKHFVVSSGNASTPTPTISSTRTIYSQNSGAGDNSYALHGEDTDAHPATQGNSSEDTHAHTLTMSGTVDQPHLNLQPTITMNYVIWTGVFP